MTGAVVNFLFALLVAGVVFAAINRMNGVTSHAVRCSILMLFVAMLGQAFSIPLKQPVYWPDTLLYGAVAAFVVSSRRLPTGLPHPTAAPITFGIIAVTLITALALGYL